MAYQRPLYQTKDLRPEQGYFPKESRTVVFAADASITLTDTVVSPTSATGDMWPLLTPAAYDQAVGKWKPWKNTLGAIEGFIIGATGHSTANQHDGVSGMLQLKAGEDVQGVVMLAGEVDYNCIFSPDAAGTPSNLAYIRDVLAAAGTVDSNLVAALSSGPRTLGLWINGLASFR